MNPGVGFYGKLPGLGDFVSRRLPRAFIDSWDQWVQASLSASQEALAEEWLNYYLVSPIWRFVISPGLCGQNAWAGVMMPSVDKVGRYYPLTLATTIPKERMLDVFLPELTFFEQLELSVLSVLSEPFDFEAFDSHLNAIRLTDIFVPPRFSNEPSTSPKQPLLKVAFRFELDSLQQTDSVMPELCQALMQHYMPTHTLWATLGSENNRASFLCCEGWPPSEAYVDFLKGTAQSGRNWEVRSAQSIIKFQSPEVIQKSLTSIDTEEGIKPSTFANWVSYGLTVVGHKRRHNEDAMLNCPERGIWVVADGMGGHQAGDMASRLIVDSLAELECNDGMDARIEVVCSKLQNINYGLCRLADDLQQGSIVGSTVVVLLAEGHECAAIWAGDSRLYRLRGGVLSKVTEDHTLLDELMACGLMSREVAELQVGANVITRAVGGQKELLLDVLRFEAQAGDRYLLCSDGLDKEVSEADIQILLGIGSCQTCAETLIDAALNGLGRDNITVVVSQYQ
jgi:type VI secretion system protein ImpM